MKSVPLLFIATICAVSPLTGTAQTPVLLRTFNNPAPEAGDHFGIGIAALGSDRVLIGAPNYIGNPTPPTNAAAVHLFHTNGTLLTTFTKPPAVGGEFGSSITTLGSDRVVIGSEFSFSVSVFTTNGALVTTITDPQPQPLGPAVVALGNDKLLIGAPEANEDPDTWDTYGGAYIYSTNGARLMTFYNPSPGTVSGFGSSVAAFGGDRVLIGVRGVWHGAGTAYLFHTNGTLLMTFTNPPSTGSSDHVGHPVAAVGVDRVLVGAPTHGTNVGAVHLFNTNGILLLTITNPTPAVDDYFGAQMAMLGNDRVVIGARGDDTTGSYSGSAYVFNLNGTLLATINNPAPGVGAGFGTRLAAFGNDGVLIAAPFHNGVGSAYLFSVPASPIAPSPTIRRTTPNTIALSWPATATGFVLQQNIDGIGSLNWSNVTTGIQDDGTNKTLIVNPTGGARFYRLVQP